MKILIKNSRFSGGGARSMLEFAKSVNDNNEIMVFGKYVEEPKYYYDAGIKTKDFENFKVYRPITNIINLNKLYKAITSYAPDIIIATGTECYSLRLLKDFIDVPVVYMWQGGVVHYVLPKFLKDESIILFSKENVDQMVNYGYDEKNVYLISNRIHVPDMVNLCREVSPVNKKCYEKSIKCALISRIDTDKIKSIKYTLDIFNSIALDNVYLDIIGDGERMEDVKKICNEINNKHGKEVITLKGYVSDVNKIIHKYDVFFGKGRSVIEPILHGKIGIVVSEDNKMCICDDNSFEELWYYNFSGRNLSKTTSEEELAELFGSILENSLDNDKFIKSSIFIDENYNSKYLGEKFSSVLEITEKNFRLGKKNRFFTKVIFCLRYIYLYFLFFLSFLTERVFKLNNGKHLF